MLLSEVDRPPSYRAPREDGGVVCYPAWPQLPELMAKGAPRDATDLFSESLASFRAAARGELLAAARAYVVAYGVAAPTGDAEGPLILAGHQPEFVHPGVWLKNFAAAELAARVGGTALHLVIDTDAIPSPSIRVPSGSRDDPIAEAVAYDAPQAPMAWEQRRIGDVQLWHSFGQRVERALGPLIASPYMRSWWPTVLQRTAAGASPGLAIAQARHLAESRWGACSLELPQSVVCQSASFRRFVCHLLAHLPRFSRAYNDSLAQFRRRHRIRNHAQPMPNLAEVGEWLEAPLWLWSDEDPRRRAVFVRATGDEVVVSDRHRFQGRLPLTADREPEAAMETLATWAASGVKLRSRALVTTLFARIALADLFIHGLGGARYDEVADRLSREFYGVDPAPYAAISGTLRLPIDHRTAGADDLRGLENRLRDLRYHPERFIVSAELSGERQGQAERLSAEKRRWIDVAKTPDNAARRHQAIEVANTQLAKLLEPVRRATEFNLSDARSRTRAATVLESREYAFCLFPQEHLQRFLLDFAAQLA